MTLKSYKRYNKCFGKGKNYIQRSSNISKKISVSYLIIELNKQRIEMGIKYSVYVDVILENNDTVLSVEMNEHFSNRDLMISMDWEMKLVKKLWILLYHINQYIFK